MNVPDERWKSLGVAIRTRREMLGMSQADLARAADLSDATVRKIEKGEPGNYRSPNLRRLEAAIQWEPNAFEAFLTGRAPEGSSEQLTLATEAMRRSRAAESPTRVSGRIGAVERKVSQLEAAVREMAATVLQLSERVLLPDADEQPGPDASQTAQ